MLHELAFQVRSQPQEGFAGNVFDGDKYVLQLQKIGES